MGVIIEVDNVVKSLNSLGMDLTLKSTNTPIYQASDEYIIATEGGGAALFQAKICHVQSTQDYVAALFVKFTKARRNDQRIYIMKLTHSNGSMRVLTSDDGTWRTAIENQTSNKIKISIEVDVILAPNHRVCKKLHLDTEMTDFELRGVDGFVRFHKAVAAACSPVLKRLFTGSWRESDSGVVEVAGVSTQTLQNLKDNMYLGIIPDTGLQQLLLLAMFYDMEDLKKDCIDKLVETVTDTMACELISFAVNQEIPELLIGILDQVQKLNLNVENIRREELVDKKD